MAYVIDANDASEPLSLREAGSAAAELRAIKAKLNAYTLVGDDVDFSSLLYLDYTDGKAVLTGDLEVTGGSTVTGISTSQAVVTTGNGTIGGTLKVTGGSVELDGAFIAKVAADTIRYASADASSSAFGIAKSDGAVGGALGLDSFGVFGLLDAAGNWIAEHSANTYLKLGVSGTRYLTVGPNGLAGAAGTVEVSGLGKGGFDGYSLKGIAGFLAPTGGGSYGLYDPVNSQWSVLSTILGKTSLYYAGVEKLATKADGAVITGNLTVDSLTVAGGGSGSGFDADLLDGQHGAFYQDASNLNAGIVPAARLTGTYAIDVSTVGGKDPATITQSSVAENINAAWKFVVNPRIENTLPRQEFYETDSAADSRRWAIGVDAGVFSLKTFTDAGAELLAPILFDRALAKLTLTGLVAVTGEVTASANVAISGTPSAGNHAMTIDYLASQRYKSGDLTIVRPGTVSASHGLSAAPINMSAMLRCVSAEHGYSVGDLINTEFTISNLGTTDRATGISVFGNATTVGVVITGNEFYAQHKSTGDHITLTDANWKIQLYAALY